MKKTELKSTKTFYKKRLRKNAWPSIALIVLMDVSKLPVELVANLLARFRRVNVWAGLTFGLMLALFILFAANAHAETINSDWIVSGSEERINEEIILNGNLVISPDSSLTLTNVKLVINSTSNGQQSINIQQWGKLYINDSEITGNYYYYFNNYGYLNIQNSSISRAYSINFYDSLLATQQSTAPHTIIISDMEHL